MQLKSLIRLSTLLIIAIYSFSCQKPANNTPVLGSPTVVLTPPSTSGYGGDQVSIDYSCLAANGIKKIIISDQYVSFSKKIDLDSTLASTVPSIDRNFIYTIPDTALAGQQTLIYFTIVDGKGDSTSKTATVSVTGSRPTITVTPASATVASGDSVLLTIVMKSPEKNIVTLDISQQIGSNAATNLPSFPYTSVSAVTQKYYYHVPSATSGTIVSLVFKVINSSAVSNVASADITVM